MTNAQVQKLLRRFVAVMKKTYGGNLGFIIHHGSWATGEARPDSDIDALVMLGEIEEKDMDKLREILSRDEFKTMTVLLFSQRDMRHYPPFARHQFHYGVKLLYGKCPLPEPTEEEMLIEIRKIADEVGFWSKYLYTHPHLAENVARKMYWRFKEAIIALKVYVHWKTGSFPVTRKKLKKLLTNPEDKEIVEIVENWEENKDQYEKNPDPLLIKGLDFSKRILRMIENSSLNFKARGGGKRSNPLTEKRRPPGGHLA